MKVDEFLKIKKIYDNGIGLVVPMEDVKDAICLARAEEKDTAVECMKIALQISEEEALNNKGSYQDPVVKFKELIRNHNSGIEIPNIKELLSKKTDIEATCLFAEKKIDWEQRKFDLVNNLIVKHLPFLFNTIHEAKEIASCSIIIADEVIKQLKEKEGE